MREQLQEWYNQLHETLLDDAAFTLIVMALVAVTSFGLGRWSVTPVTPPERPVLIPTPTAIPAASVVTAPKSVTTESVPTNSSELVASVNGTKYHALDCPGATQINEQNKIYFQTEQEARAAGYTPAANCQF